MRWAKTTPEQRSQLMRELNRKRWDKKPPRSEKDPHTVQREQSRKQWAALTPAERSAHARMMVRARWAKRKSAAAETEPAPAKRRA